MLTKVRDNLFLGDSKVKGNDLKKNKVSIVVVVTNEPLQIEIGSDMVWYQIGLFNNQVNRPYVKDIACHIPKYMMQNGEIVAVIGKTGLKRAAFVVARVICEIENRSIYEVLVELQEKIPSLDIGKAYL